MTVDDLIKQLKGYSARGDGAKAVHIECPQHDHLDRSTAEPVRSLSLEECVQSPYFRHSLVLLEDRGADEEDEVHEVLVLKL